MSKLMKLWKDEEAPTAVEYGIMVSLIAVAIIVAVGALGGQLKSVFEYVKGQISTPG